MSLTLTDLFCGAGGSSTGAVDVPGVEVRVASNHWQLAIDTHNSNHQDADHICADLSQIDPRYFPTSDLLWASPECFTAGHLVTTALGQVPIEDVDVGDVVLTHEGRWRPVIRTQSRTAETVVVKGQGHRGITTTPKHGFWLRDSSMVWHNDIRQYRREYGAPGWKPIKDAPDRGALWATPVASDWLDIPDHPDVFGFDHEAAWWLIGRWVADGSLTFGRNHEVLIACGFHQADELAGLLAATGTTWARSDKRTAAVFSVGDEKARDWLHEHFGHGAAHKQIPTWVLSLDEAGRSALLAGYASGDGHVSATSTSICTVSRALAVSARLLAESLGHRVDISMDKRTTYTIEGRTGVAKQQWIVFWTNEPSAKRAPEAFADGIHSWSRVRSVTPTGRTETVYNIEVAEDHSYVLDGIVVKNCTNHSRAKGKRKASNPGQDALWGESLPDEAAERSRATMWDVVRFTERHGYQAVIVENVVEVCDWPPYRAWLLAMESLGYRAQLVSLNSMHAQAHGLPAPQSRDRVYVVFTLKGNARPDLERMQRPRAYCPDCDAVVDAVQSWKRHDRDAMSAGRYRSQYVYRCPSVRCRNQIVEPGWLPASSIIDWSLPGQRIGDRTKPLSEKTRARIAAGIARYWGPIHMEAAGNTYDAADPKHPRHGDPNSYYRAWSVDEPLRTLHTIESKALAVPVDGRAAVDRARNETGFAFLAHLKGTSQSQLRSSHSPITDPMHTVAAGGNHHALITRHYGIKGGDPARHTTPASEVLRTLTTSPGQSMITTDDIQAAAKHVDDVRFRMLEPSECKRAMAFPEAYTMLGNRREQVRLAGNAVTPPAARDLIATVAESLGVAS